MTLNEYKSLPLNWQAVEILRKGVILDSRIKGIKKFILYQLDSFYVEIEYSNLQKKIVNPFSFYSTDYLEPYLKKIKLRLF